MTSAKFPVELETDRRGDVVAAVVEVAVVLEIPLKLFRLPGISGLECALLN